MIRKTNSVSAKDKLAEAIAALEKKEREKALASIGGAEQAEKLKLEIEEQFNQLQEKAAALTLAYNTGDDKDSYYYAPWSIQAQRPDWLIKRIIKEKGGALSVTQIADAAKKLGYAATVEIVQAVIDKDRQSERGLFKEVDGKLTVKN